LLSIVLGVRNLTRQPRRTGLALFVVAVGITAMILASGFIQWNLNFGREATIHSQLGHLRVVKSGFLESGTSDPFAFLIPDDPLLRRAIESTPHVVALAPRLNFNGLISHGDATLSFIGEGVEPAPEALLSRSLTIVAGDALATEDHESVSLGQGLAANLGVKPGDNVVLLATTARGGVNAVEVKVRGIFATITKAFDDSALRVPIQTARQLMRISGSHAYVLVLDETKNTESVAVALDRLVRDRQLVVVPWYRLADFYNKTAALFSRQVSVLRVIIAVIIVLGISNLMSMSVLERTGEIGTAMALGTRRGSIMRTFLWEGGLLGIAGGMIGLVLGYALAHLISVIGIPMPPPPGMAFGYTAGIRFTWPLGAEAFALSIVTTLLATVFPAWKASRMVVIDALRHNR
jgi:putative ABC transport system permease protein